jgi:hypothetical protein
MLRWTGAKASWSNRSGEATCEHTHPISSSTRLQLMGGDEESGEPSRYSSDTPRFMAPKDPGAGAAPPKIPALALALALPNPAANSRCHPQARGRHQPSQHRWRPMECRLRPVPLLPTPPLVTDGRLEPMMCDSYHQGTVPLDSGSMADIGNQQYMRTRRTPAGKTKGGPSSTRAPHP